MQESDRLPQLRRTIPTDGHRRPLGLKTIPDGLIWWQHHRDREDKRSTLASPGQKRQTSSLISQVKESPMPVIGAALQGAGSLVRVFAPNATNLCTRQRGDTVTFNC
jgi:hypothetical protein